MDIITKHFSELSASELYEIVRARIAVFVVEQTCPYQELDGKDLNAYHVVLRDENEIAAYCRVLDRGVSYENEPSIGRVITIRRGTGCGLIVMREGIRIAQEKYGARAIRISAQKYAKGFYEKCGFRQVSEEYLEDDIPHIQMLWESAENLSYEKANMSDLPHLCELFRSAAEEMSKRGIEQWDDIYPSAKDLKCDIECGEMYLVKCGSETAAAFALNNKYDESYELGQWKHDVPFAVLHRLCVDPKFQNRGIAAKAVKHIEKLLAENSVEAIRLDVYSLNPFALRLYEKLGFERAGTVNYRKGEFYLMEKMLGQV